jgi:four helix bundle protein
MIVKSYKDLDVWQEAIKLVVECYKHTMNFPKAEIYGLTSQLQRAAVSVPANIAEGCGRQHTREFIYHVSIAYGSLAELETHIQIAMQLDYLNSNQSLHLLNLSGRVGRMLNGLRKSLQNKLD